jgi:pimeloyl-ACP methyl ester carboxylesterase
MSLKVRSAVILVLLNIIVSFNIMVAQPAMATQQCEDVSVATSLSPGAPRDYEVFGQYCDADSRHDVLQILVHGGTYDHTYWDFPGHEDEYSYTVAAERAGYATLAIDKLGVGRSSTPPSHLLTEDAQAHALHTVIEASRNGDFGRAWKKIVLVGHSLGTVTSYIEIATYGDVDGLIATGSSHGPGAEGFPAILGKLIPAINDPITAKQVPPHDLGYLSAPGARDVFYEMSTSDPLIVQADESMRKPVALAEGVTMAQYLPATLQIDIPVLLANGDKDKASCGGAGGVSIIDCSTEAALYLSEKPFFPLADLQTFILPGAGHNASLSTNNRLLSDRMLAWVQRL